MSNSTVQLVQAPTTHHQLMATIEDTPLNKHASSEEGRMGMLSAPCPKRSKISAHSDVSSGVPRPHSPASTGSSGSALASDRMIGVGHLPQRKEGKKKGKGGSSCHQCKSRRNYTALTYCTSNLDKKNKNCRKKFCEHCLKKFYKEQAPTPTEKTSWRCPSCRKICCCAACRRRKLRDLHDDGCPQQDMSQPPTAASAVMALSSQENTGARAPPVSQKTQKQGATLQDNSARYGVRPRPRTPQRTNTSRSLLVDQPATRDGVYPTPMDTPAAGDEPFIDGGCSSTYASSSEPSTSDSDSDSYSSCSDSDEGAEQMDLDSPRAVELHNQEFALLFHISHTPVVNKYISYLTDRADLTDEQKVQAVAQLLRSTLSFSS